MALKPNASPDGGDGVLWKQLGAGLLALVFVVGGWQVAVQNGRIASLERDNVDTRERLTRVETSAAYTQQQLEGVVADLKELTRDLRAQIDRLKERTPRGTTLGGQQFDK